jgi:hypothetical protein
MNLEHAFQYAEYMAHTYCYPEFHDGKLSEKEQKRRDQSPPAVHRSSERKAAVSPLPQSQHREAQRAARVSKL